MSTAILDFSDYIADRTRDFTGREWVFAEIDRWLVNPDGPSFFVITGAPGSGKSAITAHLVQTRPDLVAFHSCIARNARTIDPLLFTRALSNQLCRFNGFAAGILKDSNIDLHAVQNIQANYGQAIAIKIENLTVNAPSATVAFTHSVIEPLEALYTNGFDRQILVVVDGLDEAVQQPGRETIVSLLANTGKLPHQVRCLLTSRPEGMVLDHFESQAIQLFELDRRREDNLKDVQQYVDQQVTHSEIATKLQEELARRDLEPEALVQEIVHASDGNFLYVVWLLRSIAEGTQRIDKLKAFPQGLDGIYREFLRTRRLRDDKRLWRGTYRPVLGVLAAAQAELDITQLGNFTGLEKQDLQDALDDLQQFMDPVRFAQNRYQFYHQSVVDFLGNEDQTKEFWIDPEPTHRRIVDYYQGKVSTWKEVDWSQVDDYGLRYIAHHLLGAGQELYEDLYELINPDWRRLKLDRLHSDYSFLSDVELALDVTRREAADRLPRFIGLCMMAATIVSKSNDVIPEAIGAMMALNQEGRALAYVQTITDAGVRSGAFLQMARASWHSGKVDQAREYLDAALKEGQRESVRTIYGNPKPLFDDLIRWGYIDEAVAINDLLHTRMPSIMNSRLAECQQMLANHICTTQLSRVSELRERCPDTFGCLVTVDGMIDPTFSPPRDKGIAGLQEFEPDPVVLKIYEPCIEALDRAELLLAQGTIASVQAKLDAIERIGADNSWILAGPNSISIGSEPWWPAMVMRARVGPMHRLEALIDEIEPALDARSSSAWGGWMAYSAALGEVAIQLARNSQRYDAERILRRLMSYCESLSFMELAVDKVKRSVARLFHDRYGLTQESRDVLGSEYGIAEREADSGRPTNTPSDLAMRWIADSAARGSVLPEVIPVGTRDDVRLGASLARYVNELPVNGMLAATRVMQYLEVALEEVCSGQWEPTRWWGERTEGIALIGQALRELASVNREWAESFLMHYFGKARFNGRHACWLHFLHALPTLHFLDPDSLPQTWHHIATVEEWVLSGRLRTARNLCRLGRKAEDAGKRDIALRRFFLSLQICEHSDPTLAETVRQNLTRMIGE